jgi:hypothetical protein
MNAIADQTAFDDPALDDLAVENNPPQPINTESVELVISYSGIDDLKENPEIDTVVVSLRKLAEKSKDYDPLLRAACREATIIKLQAIGVRSPAALVDAAFNIVSPTDDLSDRIGFVEPLPWPDQVQGPDLLQDLANVFCQYIVISASDATALALWSLLTYLSDSTWILPLLLITSPEKRCGKTLVLEVLQSMVLRPLPAANISAASLFRVVEKYRPTLLIDEADTFLGDNEELRGVINSGHRRSSAFVLRCDGDDREPKSFSTWCPKAIALIGKLADTLEDRSIIIRMRRKTAEDRVQRLRSDLIGQELEMLRRKAARWARDNATLVRLADPIVPSELHDRASDNWRPILAIADLIGGIWPELAREAAVKLSDGSADDGDSIRSQLLQDIKKVFEEKSTTRISSEDLAKALGAMIESPWSEWKKGKPITQRQIARLLKPFGIDPVQLWIVGAKTRGYEYDDAFRDACVRYIDGFDPVGTVGASNDAGSMRIFNPVCEKGATE